MSPPAPDMVTDDSRRPARTGRTGRRPAVALVAAIVAAAGLAALFVAPDSDLSPEAQRLREFERWLDSAELDPVPEPAAIDADAQLARVLAAVPGSDVAPEPALPAAGSVTVHEFADAAFRALASADPWTAVAFGFHPHPTIPREETPDVHGRFARTTRAALREIDRWPLSQLGRHDRLDLRLLRTHFEGSLRGGVSSSYDALIDLDATMSRIAAARDLRCCGVADRLRLTREILAATPARLDAAMDALRRPNGGDPPAEVTVLTVAARLTDDSRSLAEFPVMWEGLDAGAISALREACAPVCDAIERAARTLRAEIAPVASGAPGMGRERFAAVLRAHGLRGDPRAVYRIALEEARSAIARMEAIRGEAPDSLPAKSSALLLDNLASKVHVWLPEAPADPGLAAVSMSSWDSRAFGGLYHAPGPYAGVVPAVISIPEAAAGMPLGERRVHDLRRAHTIAHEAYPGHRLADLVQAESCIVRRVLADAMSAEGWAVYAEDLAHEAGCCSGGPWDDWVRADDRLGFAESALFEILIATGAASPREISAIARGDEDQGPDEEAAMRRVAGEIALFGGRHVAYVVGPHELRALRDEEQRRLGPAFDSRDFHRRFLGEGAVPIPWIRAAWAERR